MKNCRPNTWWVKLIDKFFGIRIICDQRCLGANYDAPCQFPKLNKGCCGTCNQGRLECNCDIKETK
jgi:hypothetical protein